jgi:hypothetical protein
MALMYCSSRELLGWEQHQSHAAYNITPSWGANSCPADQEIPRPLWNLKVHYSVHNIPSLVSVLSQINPVHTLAPCFCKIRFNIIPFVTNSNMLGFYGEGSPPIVGCPWLHIQTSLPGCRPHHQQSKEVPCRGDKGLTQHDRQHFRFSLYFG